jgi:CBS domain containing-hemolysin-like protein
MKAAAVQATMLEVTCPRASLHLPPNTFPDEAPLALRLVAVILLVAANAFFVAAEFSLVASRRTRIEAMARRGDRRARTVLQALQDVYRQLSAAQLGITLASIMLGYVAEDTVAHVFSGWFAALPPALDFLARGGVASAVAVSIITFLHVVFGEQAPKAWAITHPEATSRWIARPLILFSWITRPVTDLLNRSASGVVRLLGIRGTSAELERIHSPEEIRMLVEQSRKRGGLEAEDARLLEGVFEFSEKNARDVMTPRTQMVALPVTLSVAVAADRVATAGRSRYPVYRESVDDIVGIVHAKDVLRGLRQGQGAVTLERILRPPLFVPGTREVEDVLTDMKRQKIHLAIVLDEYGGTAGLVTMEDLLEEIVGQIYDEYDRSPPEGGASASGASGPAPAGIIAGNMEIGDVNDTYGLQLDDTDYTTIGGLVFGALGRLPRVGDVVTLGGTTFEVVEMEGRRVGKLKVTRHAAKARG